MPTYEFECYNHGQFEQTMSMSAHSELQVVDKCKATPCPECGELSKQLVSQGATFGEEAAWLNDPMVNGCLKDPSERPITTRSEYKKTLKEKGIVERC